MYGYGHYYCKSSTQATCNRTMASHIAVQGSIRCGHLNDVDLQRCSHPQPCQLGMETFQIIIEVCERCKKDKTLQENFNNLKDKPSLLLYWHNRKLSEDRHLFGPFRLGVRVSVPILDMDPEMENMMYDTWKKEVRGFIKRASLRSRKVYMEDEGYISICSVDELDSNEDNVLLNRAMEKILEETELPQVI